MFGTLSIPHAAQHAKSQNGVFYFSHRVLFRVLTIPQFRGLYSICWDNVVWCVTKRWSVLDSLCTCLIRAVTMNGISIKDLRSPLIPALWVSV